MKMRKHCVALVLFVCILASCTKESTDITDIENATELEQEVFLVVNEHRIQLGQTALEFNEVAYEYANQHNDYMISLGDISHDNFSSRATKISEKVSAVYVAENVAKNYDTATEVLQGWLNSASHKKTMEDDFTHTAVSVKRNSSGKFYYTQIFFR